MRRAAQQGDEADEARSTSELRSLSPVLGRQEEWSGGAVPNGRSGGFLIDRADLLIVLESLPSTCEIGLQLDFGSRGASGEVLSTQVNAGAAITMLAALRWDRVWIEEQDHRRYIIHFDRSPITTDSVDDGKWIDVGPESPLFDGLRKAHDRQPNSTR